MCLYCCAGKSHDHWLQMGEEEKQNGQTRDNYRMHLNASRSSSCVLNPGCAHPPQLSCTYSATRCSGVQSTLALRFGLHAADICATFWLTEWIPNYTLE